MNTDTVVPATVVVAVRDAAAHLAALLASLHEQIALPAEMIVVDRGSSDGTVRLLCEWDPPAPMVFSVIQAVHASVSEARNVAIEAATFDIILMTDAAAVAHRGWVDNLWTALQSGADVAGGPVLPVGSTGLPTASALAHSPFESASGEEFVPSGANIGFRVASWDAVGGYPEWLPAGEDAVFVAALHGVGAQVAFAPSAVTSWQHNPALPAVLAGVFRSSTACGRAEVPHRPLRTPQAIDGSAAVRTASGRVAIRSLCFVTVLLVNVTAAAGYLTGRAAARIRPEPVHLRVNEFGGFMHRAQRLRWHPFDKVQQCAPGSPSVASAG